MLSVPAEVVKEELAFPVSVMAPPVEVKPALPVINPDEVTAPAFQIPVVRVPTLVKEDPVTFDANVVPWISDAALTLMVAFGKVYVLSDPVRSAVVIIPLNVAPVPVVWGNILIVSALAVVEDTTTAPVVVVVKLIF